MNHEKLDQLIDEMGKLKPQENGYIFFKLLRNNKVNFTELSKSYVQALEEEREEVYQKLLDACTNLSQYDKMEVLDYHDKKAKRNDLVLAVKSAEALINAGLFRDTVYEQNLKDRIEYIRTQHPTLDIFKYPPYAI